MKENGSDPDFRRLLVFRTVVRAGSLVAASSELHKSPPAISYDLRKLEARLGFQLFQKSGRGMVPTPEGRALAAATDRAFLDLSEAWLHAGKSLQIEPLRVAVVSGFGRYRLVPALLSAFENKRPLEVLFRTADKVQELVERGRIDFGFSYRPHLAMGINASPFCEEELVLIGPPGTKPPPKPQVEALLFVTYEEFDYVFVKWFEANKLPLPTRWRRGDHFDELEEAMEAVASGRGWSIVPADAAAAPGVRQRVAAFRLGKPCINTVFLLYRSSMPNSNDLSKMEALSKALREQATSDM